MTYSSMANFQGEGGVDTAPKEEKKQVSTIANDYQNYSYTPLEEEVDIPTYEDNTDTKETDNLGFGSSPSGEFGGAGLGAKPVTPTPISGGGNNEDDTQSNSYLTDVTTNLINAASGNISTVKKFFGYEDKDTDKDFDVVYDEYVELYMPPELKAKNVPLGPKGVLSNYVPYVTTYNIGGEDSAIPQESLVDSRGEFPYTDEYRAKVKAILDADVDRRQAILDDAELIKKSDELGISTQKALELYYNSISSSVAPKSPAFERIQVADSGAGFGALFDAENATTTAPGLQGFLGKNKFSDEDSGIWEKQIKSGNFPKKIEPETSKYTDWQTYGRKGTLKDITKAVTGYLDASKFKPESNLEISSSTSTDESNSEYGLVRFLKSIDPKLKAKGVGVDVDTPFGKASMFSEWDGDTNLKFMFNNTTYSINSDGEAEISIEFKY